MPVRGRAVTPTLHVAESPAAYARRPLLIADATVLAAAIFGEPERDQAAALLQGRALAAPHLIDYEMANVAVKKMRRDRVSEKAVGEALAAYAAVTIERYPTDPVAMLTLAARYQLTAYDAAYLWLAEHLAVPLATFDAKLADGARRHLIVAGR